MMDRFKAGLGFGLIAILLLSAVEQLVGAKLDRDGMSLIVLVAASVGASFPS